MSTEPLLGFFIAFLLALFRPAWALTVVAFSLPSYEMRYQIGPLPTTLLEMLLLGTVLGWIVRRRGALAPGWRPWIAPAALLVLIAFAEAFVAPDHRAGLGLWRAYFLEPALLFFVALDALRSERAVRWTIAALGVVVLLVAAVTTLQYLGIFTSPAPWVLESPKRVVGMFSYPNAVGLFVAPMVALFGGIALGPAFRSLRRWEQLFVLAVMAGGALSAVFAVSRGALLGIAAGMFFLGMLHKRRRQVLGGLAALLVLLLLLPTTRSMLVNILSLHGDVSTDVRTVLWQGTVSLLRAHPLLGAGLGGFPSLYDEYRLAQHTELPLYPHMIVFNFWVELGVAGLLVMTWIFLRALRSGIKVVCSSASPFWQSIALGGLASFITIIVHGLVDVPYFKNDLAVAFWVLVALLEVARQQNARQVE